MAADGQANVTIKVITADEYDEATRRSPASCPLYAIGDTRSVGPRCMRGRGRAGAWGRAQIRNGSLGGEASRLGTQSGRRRRARGRRRSGRELLEDFGADAGLRIAGLGRDRRSGHLLGCMRSYLHGLDQRLTPPVAAATAHFASNG